MKIKRKTMVNSLWFTVEVVAIFLVVQLIRFIISNLDAVYIGLALIIISLALFFSAYLVARNKDRANNIKSITKTYSGFSN